MKRNATIILTCFILLFFARCQSAKTPPDTAIKPEKTQVNKPFISGVVIEIQRGKDGYTAKITTKNGQVYYATVSYSNLKDPVQYKSAKTGDTLQVLGDMWKMEQQNHITVREMK